MFFYTEANLILTGPALLVTESFVRVTDDYIDQVPSDSNSFKEIQSRWKSAKKELSKGKLPPEGKDLIGMVIFNIL